MLKILCASLSRGCRQLVSRRIYVWLIALIPLGCLFFFTNLMHSGLPLPVPVGLVDMDHSSMSRQVTRMLRANQYIDIVEVSDDYAQALDRVKRGESFGFFYVPDNFQKNALAGKSPTLSFYTNMSIYIPGTMSYKGFKTVAVSTKGGLVQTTLVSAGVNEATVGSMLQPVVVQDHPIGNPWLNYCYYLNNSFMPGLLCLMVLLTTAFSLGTEIKRGTSGEWLQTSGGSIVVALFGKLAPQTVLFSIVGIAMESVFFNYLNYPIHCSLWTMIAAVVMTVIGCQAFAVAVFGLLPNLRLALTLCALTGILSFSVLGFSFPVQQMYGGVGIFSWIMPLRYYFLIYIDQALNGIPLYYSRWWFAALAAFILLPLPLLKRIKGRCLKPVYVP